MSIRAISVLPIEAEGKWRASRKPALLWRQLKFPMVEENSDGVREEPQARPCRLAEDDQTTTTSSAGRRVSTDRKCQHERIEEWSGSEDRGDVLSQPQRSIQPRPGCDWLTRLDPLTEIGRGAELRLRTALKRDTKAWFEHLQVLRSEPFSATL
jgi:hypothetical protein